MGPYYIQSNDFQRYLKIGDSIEDLKKNSAFGIILKILEDFSILLFILNSLQASVLPFLLNAKLPPNLYFVLRIFGMFVMPTCPNWNERIKSHQTQELIRFSRLGFENSIIDAYKYNIIIYMIFGLVSILFIILDTVLVKSKVRLLNIFFQKLTFAFLETNLILIFTPVFLIMFSRNYQTNTFNVLIVALLFFITAINLAVVHKNRFRIDY